MNLLQETNIKILELLERFKYLSSSQLIKLGVAGHQASISRIIKRFDSKKSMIHTLTFPIDYKYGRVENIYFMSKYGAEFLSEYREVEITDIYYIKGNGIFKDYQHRKSQVTYYIDLYLKSIKENFAIDFFLNYFDKIGTNGKNSNQKLESKTKIIYNDNSFFIPDGIYQITKNRKDGIKQAYLYALEIHKGKETKRAIETIEKHIKALIDGSISKKYNYDYICQVVIVFDDENCKRLVLKRLEELEKWEEFKGVFELKC